MISIAAFLEPLTFSTQLLAEFSDLGKRTKDSRKIFSTIYIFKFSPGGCIFMKNNNAIIRQGILQDRSIKGVVFSKRVTTLNVL